MALKTFLTYTLAESLAEKLYKTAPHRDRILATGCETVGELHSAKLIYGVVSEEAEAEIREFCEREGAAVFIADRNKEREPIRDLFIEPAPAKTEDLFVEEDRRRRYRKVDPATAVEVDALLDADKRIEAILVLKAKGYDERAAAMEWEGYQLTEKALAETRGGL